jgi:hypothetical protein
MSASSVQAQGQRIRRRRHSPIMGLRVGSRSPALGEARVITSAARQMDPAVLSAQWPLPGYGRA